MTRYRKSWTQVLQEVREDCVDCKCDPCECATPGENYPEGHEPQGIDDQYMEESAALQLKMAFDDAGIKVKGAKGGKLVIDKKDKKKVEKVIAKQMKKPADAKRVLGSQIVFEAVLADKDYKYDGKVVKISKKNFSKVHKDFKGTTKGKETMLVLDPKSGGTILVPVQFEEMGNVAPTAPDSGGIQYQAPVLGQKKKKKTQKIDEGVQRTTFAGKDVFIVDSDTFHNCRMGKKKYGRYEKYVGDGKVGQTIREYGLKYPRRPIILQNGESGPMLYLKYGRS